MSGGNGASHPGGTMKRLLAASDTEAVATFPAVSEATTVSVCAPSGTVVESHEKLWVGGETTAITAPSTRYSSLAPAVLSVAETVTATMPETVLPAEGEVKDTEGGIVSRGGAVPER